MTQVGARDVQVQLVCMPTSEAEFVIATAARDSCRTVESSRDLVIELKVGPPPAVAITAAGPYVGPPGFDRGMQTTRYCGNQPESWVRGSAVLRPNDGEIAVAVQLETDSVVAGPKGRVQIAIRGSDGAQLATLSSSEVGIGGKPPGRAVQRNFSASVRLSEYVAKQAASASIEVSCTGTITSVANPNPQGVLSMTIGPP